MTELNPYYRPIRRRRSLWRTPPTLEEQLHREKLRGELRAVVAIQEAKNAAAVTSNSVKLIKDVHDVARSCVSSYSMAEALSVQLNPAAAHRFAAIGARMMIEIDEALDHGSHRIMGREQ